MITFQSNFISCDSEHIFRFDLVSPKENFILHICIFISIWTFEIEPFRFCPQYEIYLTEGFFEDEIRYMATYDIEIKAEQ